MESCKDQNKGDGFIGSFDVDGIHSRMNRLKEVDAGRNSNPNVNLRKPIRGLQNPNALFEGSSVPLNTLGDIVNLTKAIDLGKLEVWSTLPSEKHSGKSDVGIGESLTCVEGVAAFLECL
ncbi:hypothetical protein Tco_0999253 [Tanacetum coccineum]